MCCGIIAPELLARCGERVSCGCVAGVAPSVRRFTVVWNYSCVSYTHAHLHTNSHLSQVAFCLYTASLMVVSHTSVSSSSGREMRCSRGRELKGQCLFSVLCRCYIWWTCDEKAVVSTTAIVGVWVTCFSSCFCFVKHHHDRVNWILMLSCLGGDCENV